MLVTPRPGRRAGSEIIHQKRAPGRSRRHSAKHNEEAPAVREPGLLEIEPAGWALGGALAGAGSYR